MDCRPALLRALVLVIPVVIVGGCASYQIRTPSSSPVESQYVEITAHAFFWDMIRSPEVISAEGQAGSQGQDGINDVIVEDNLLYDLISVLTIGIWKPMTVKYRLRQPPLTDGPDGPFPTPEEVEEHDADANP